MKNAQCYKKGYPRPRLVRDSFTLLDGEWDFAFDMDNDGEVRGLTKAAVLPLKINVPYAYNTAKSGINDSRDCDCVWYARKFNAKKTKGKRLLLNFEGADYFTDIWLNGIYVGGHEGGYTRFTFDITLHIKAVNVLTVRCRDPFDPAYPRGKQRHLPQNTGCFYSPTTGIWKSVWLEEVSDSYIAGAFPVIDYDSVSAKINFLINGEHKGLTVTARASFGGENICDVTVAVMAAEVSLTLELTNRSQQLPIKCWSAGKSDQFFDLEYTLSCNGCVIDTVRSYTALVDYRANGDRILVNYLPSTYFRMVLAQGYYSGGGLTATEEELLSDVLLIKEMGFNGVRMHQKIEDERFYYFCDIVGLYVWLEMPSAYVTDERTIKAMFSQWTEAVSQYRGYASIMAYVPFNESWGALNILSNKRQQAFNAALYWQTKALISSGFVVGNDGWEHTETDLATLHNYTQSGESMAEAYTDLDRFLNNGRVSDLYTRTAFADSWHYKGQPVLISEYGGVKFASSAEGWGYGNAATSEEQLESRLRELTAAITKNKRVVGYCLTQFTDVEQEVNGLTTIDRVPKIAIEKIKEINRI